MVGLLDCERITLEVVDGAREYEVTGKLSVGNPSGDKVVIDSDIFSAKVKTTMASM